LLQHGCGRCLSHNPILHKLKHYSERVLNNAQMKNRFGDLLNVYGINWLASLLLKKFVNEQVTTVVVLPKQFMEVIFSRVSIVFPLA